MRVDLHTSSAFSFLRAASLPETLVERAEGLGYTAIGLLDRDGVYGAPRFHKAATSAHLKPIIGAELTMAWGERREGTAPPLPWVLPVLAASQAGWRNLCRLVTRMKLRAPKGEGALTLEDLAEFPDGLVALPGRPLLQANRFGVGGLLERLIGIFGRDNVFVEWQRHLRRDQEDDNEMLVCLAEAFRVPLVATGGVRYAAPEERPLFDVLTCIREHTTLTAAGRRLAANAECYLRPPAQLTRLFADRPEALRNAEALAERLTFTMTDLGYRFPRYPVPPGETAISFLRKIADLGARDRFRPYHDEARAQIARELDLIEKLDLAGYFLIVWDIVNFCRQEDILVQGRGSAANSAVCYSLGITAIDPVKMQMLFERFLSEERGEWPDIDLDLPSGDRRERVIQHVFQKYGQHGAAMTANVISYRGKSAAREVGKALGIDPLQIDRLAKVMHQFEFVDPQETLSRNMKTVGIAADDPRTGHFMRLWRQMQDLPRHLGQHSGGMVICQGELSSVVPLENASMPNRVVVQWDKEDCADMGLIKVDLLGLGMMAVLQDAIHLVNSEPAVGSRESAVSHALTVDRAAMAGGLPTPDSRLPARFDLAHLPPDDPDVYAMLRAADTIGVFQVESRAQMATLPRLKPTTFYDLVVEVAIIRPGPIVGQMVHPYLNRRDGKEAVTYPHPVLEPILKRTLGVPLFQEQLLRMAMAVAGFTGGQAEDLRRAMGFKRSEKRMKQIEIQLREGMARNGITGAAADRIALSISSFALYGFPESHAASFAQLAYASAYLKMHYPAAFYTALLNNQPMGFYHPATLVKDAQRRGVRFTPIDVQVSAWDCTVDVDGAIRLGLRFVSGLREEVGRRIAQRRVSNSEVRSQKSEIACPKCGCDDRSLIEHAPDGRRFCNQCAHAWATIDEAPRRFRSIDELVRLTGIRRDEIMVLAEIGALNALGHDRRSALWQAERAVRPPGELFDNDQCTMHNAQHALEPSNLRTVEPIEPIEPIEPVEPIEPASPLPPMSPAEQLVADYAGTGLTIGKHPMAFRRQELALRGALRAIDLPRVRDGRRVRTAGMVITRQRPGTAKGFVFLTLEDETGISNIIIRPDLFDDTRLTVVESPFLLIDGILQNQNGVTSIKAEQILKLEGFGNDEAFESHDFH